MIAEVRLRPEVEGDLLEAAVWYEGQRAGLGEDFLDAAAFTLSRIASSPSACSIVYRSTRRALFSRFPFGVFYQVEDRCIVVVAILHGSRHPRSWRKRL
jgi:plasmid stabilization system protein ParE